LVKEFDETEYIYPNDVVVGHYSLLLDKAAMRGMRCFIMNLKNHKVPDVYLDKFYPLPEEYVALDSLNQQNSILSDTDSKAFTIMRDVIQKKC